MENGPFMEVYRNSLSMKHGDFPYSHVESPKVTWLLRESLGLARTDHQWRQQQDFTMQGLCQHMLSSALYSCQSWYAIYIIYIYTNIYLYIEIILYICIYIYGTSRASWQPPCLLFHGRSLQEEFSSSLAAQENLFTFFQGLPLRRAMEHKQKS